MSIWKSSIGSYSPPVNPPAEEATYTRPTDWLSLPNVIEGEEKFIGLYAITEDTRYVSFTVEGDYSVDWGDGSSIENFSTQTQATHIYDYSLLSEQSLSSRGYKQAIITITPQENNNLTSILLESPLWLDINLVGQYVSSFSYYDPADDYKKPNLLQRFNFIGANQISSFYNFFGYYKSLEIVEALDTSLSTDFSYMFDSCDNLKYIPTFNTSLGENFSAMFMSCTSLKSIPILDTSAGIYFSSMFSSCSSLEEAPLLNTSNGIEFYDMFSYCYYLKEVPAFDFSLGTDLSYLFSSCYSLQTIPLIDTSSVQNVTGMFYMCVSLKNIPLLNFANVTVARDLFSMCYSLEKLPLLNLSSTTQATGFCDKCYSLVTVPAIDFSNVVDNIIFNECYNLSQYNVIHTTVSTQFSKCNLSRSAIVTFFNNLDTCIYPSGFGTQIYLGGNPGASELVQEDLDIAINKGYTVVV